MFSLIVVGRFLVYVHFGGANPSGSYVIEYFSRAVINNFLIIKKGNNHCIGHVYKSQLFLNQSFQLGVLVIMYHFSGPYWRGALIT